jgi:signal transduction histidine kinase
MNIFSVPFSAWFAILSAVFLFVLGMLVFFQNPKNPLNRLFGLICLVFMIWMFGTFMMFLGGAFGVDDLWTIFWDRFVYIGVVFMPALQYHFSLVIVGRKLNRLALISYVLSFIFLVLSRTDLFTSGLFRYRWGVHTVAGPLHHLFLVFFFFYIFALLIVLMRHLRSVSDRAEQKRTVLSIVAFAILNLVGGLGYLPAYGIGILPVSLIAPTVFAAIIGYSILKYRFLEVKTFAAQIAVGVMLMINGVQFFTAKSVPDIFLNLFSFILMSVIGYFLVKSVKKEVERKEELQQISDSLAEANQRLKELDNIKTEFISIASHQLRTPLTAIKGYLSLLLEGSYGVISPEITDVLEKLNLVNRNLIQLVEDLLNVSRIDAGRIQYSYAPTNVGSLVSEKVDMFMPLARERNVGLSLQLPRQALPELMLDAVKIRESVSNLIDNALKYTERGSINVSVEEMSGEMVRITVADTGIGFRSEDGAKLFDKFVRTKETTKAYVSGTGLGLYVGRSFVAAHGGRMFAESDGIGKGARFIIDLPFVNPKSPGRIGNEK